MKCWSAILLLALTACSNQSASVKKPIAQLENTDSATVKKDETEHAAKVLALESFANMPKAMKGCSALFAADTMALHNNNYLLVTNLTDKAYIKVNGRLVALKMVNKIDEDALIKVIYRGAGYMVHLVLHKVKATDDGNWIYSGEMLLLKDDQQQSQSLVGLSGC